MCRKCPKLTILYLWVCFSDRTQKLIFEFWIFLNFYFWFVINLQWLAMACKVRKVAPPWPVYPPQAAAPPWPRAQQALSAALGPSRSVFLGRFFLPKPATRSKFTLEFTLETRLLGKLSVVPVLGIRYQVLGNSTGKNIHNLKCIYQYKGGTVVPGTKLRRTDDYRTSSADKKTGA